MRIPGRADNWQRIGAVSTLLAAQSDRHGVDDDRQGLGLCAAHVEWSRAE